MVHVTRDARDARYGLNPARGELKWAGHSEYEWNGDAWVATGKREPGWTNTPHAGEPEGSRDRKSLTWAELGEPPVGHRRLKHDKYGGVLGWEEWRGKSLGWGLLSDAKPATAAEKKPSIDALLNERQSTHGDFGDNAKISQATKSLWRSFSGWEKLDDDMKEVLEMEALKVGRILSGKPTEPDHWIDASGYPQMIANRLRFGKYKV
jgi:hypothetical protein